MHYCGLDVATGTSYIFVQDEKGRKVACGEVATGPEALTGRLKPWLKGGLKVAIEAGNQTAWIHDCLKEMGADVVVVNPNRVRAIAESRRKTDKIDAKILSDLLRVEALPRPVHMPGKESRELRGLLAARQQLVRGRARQINAMRGFLRQEGIILPARALNTHKGWEALRERTYKHAHLATVVEVYYANFVALTKGIKALEEKLKERAAKDPRVELLKGMPCVGMIGALTLIAGIDEVERFPSGREVVRYAGLAPGVRQSGGRTVYGPIDREGRSEIRAVWVQIAHLVANDTSRATGRLRAWYWRVAKRRGKKVAVVALARKQIRIAYQILKTGEPFDPKKVSRAA
ncbi:MAG: IS110 family transposase [Planctomycetota bacterium]|nr:IS110 family transposase [Planctomycetota bacterium]